MYAFMYAHISAVLPPAVVVHAAAAAAAVGIGHDAPRSPSTYESAATAAAAGRS